MQIGTLTPKIIDVIILIDFYIGFCDSSTFSMTFYVFRRVMSMGGKAELWDQVASRAEALIS